jgi:Novel STAND NTPase 1
MSQPSTSTPGAVVVMGLRADVLGRCVEVPELADAVQSRCMVLGPMSKTELREVVTGPAKLARLRIEAGLVDLILHDVAAEKNLAHTTGRLPLLSHVLAGTWQQRRNDKLTAAGYTSAGGLRGSVETTGEQAWSQLNEEQRGIARSMLLRLITISESGYDTCRREPKHELLARFADADNAAKVLEILTAARLLTIHDSDVMFTHEIVLRAWVRLAGWINDDRASAPVRQRAEADAAAWIKNGRQKPFLRATRGRAQRVDSQIGGRSCRVRSSWSVFEIDPCPGVRRRILSVRGAKPGVKAQGPLFRLGEQPGEGKAGRANASEPLMMPREI